MNSKNKVDKRISSDDEKPKPNDLHGTPSSLKHDYLERLKFKQEETVTKQENKELPK